MSASADDRRFSPGEWYAVSGDAVTLVLPPSARTRVAALWELADRGAVADELLEAVLADGFRSLSDLVLLDRSGETIRVIVRGSAVAVVSAPDSEVTVAAVPGTVWNEQLVAGASGVRVRLDGEPATAGSTLVAGITRVSYVELGTFASDTPGATATEALDEPAAIDEAAPAEQLAPAEAEEPARPEQPALAEPEAPALPQEPAAFEEWAPLEERAPLDEPWAPSAPSAEPPGQDDAPQQEDWSDRDGHTQAGQHVQEFTRPPVPGQEQAPPVISRPVAKLVFSTGEVVEVDRVVLAGRAPEARRFASHDQPRLLTLPSPNQEISSTHLEVRPGAGADHGMAIVTDLGSTNGTVLMQPGLPPEDLRPGIAVSLIPGAVLDLGDGVTIQVTNP